MPKLWIVCCITGKAMISPCSCLVVAGTKDEVRALLQQSCGRRGNILREVHPDDLINGYRIVLVKEEADNAN